MTLKDRNKSFDAKFSSHQLDKRGLLLDHLWWLRSDKNDERKSIFRTFEYIIKIVGISQTDVLFSGHLAIDLKIFKFPFQRQINIKF